jgi:cytochrome c551/c552
MKIEFLKYIKPLLLVTLIGFVNVIKAQDDPDAPAVNKDALRVAAEDDYYPIVTLPIPEDILIEGGGIATLPDGRLAVATRRGHVWMIENALSTDGRCNYKLFASGLHEPLGCLYKDNALYIAQRGELTKLVDETGDGIADVYETVYAWPLSGHYHEYSFGPAPAPDGSFFVTGNVAFGDEEWWRGESRVPMRGWTMKITPDGKMEPWATGMRSPAGYGMYEGELFYDDNQGDWIGSGAIWHVKKGAFTGHPAGLKWTPIVKDSPVKLTTDQLYAKVDPMMKRNDKGGAIKPENDEKDINTKPFYEMKAQFPEMQVPAVWLPHGILGISNAEIKVNNTNGRFGPFDGQLFVGDQGQSKIMRVFLEKINGEYQGAAFDFRSDFQSGAMRMDWASDGSLFVGQTNRGWGSAGDKNEGLQRVFWNGKMPFEMKEVKSTPDGFEISFTKPADLASLKNLNNYEGRSFTYKYFPVYGSPQIRNADLKIEGVKVSDDGMKVRMVISNLTRYHVHELDLSGIKDASGKGLLHSKFFYTLNNIPEGAKLASTELIKTKSKPSTTKSSKAAASKTSNSSAAPKAATTSSAPTYAEVLPLLKKYTCVACHNNIKKQVGPSYKDIAKRNYSNEKILQLIYKPEPSNWPEYATPMAAMPQVKRGDGLRIAEFINSLK